MDAVFVLSETPGFHLTLLVKQGWKAAKILKETGLNESVLVLFDRDLGDFEDEVEDEDGDIGNFLANNLEDVPEFFGGNLNKIYGL